MGMEGAQPKEKLAEIVLGDYEEAARLQGNMHVPKLDLR